MDPNTLFHLRKRPRKRRPANCYVGKRYSFGVSNKTSGSTGLLAVEFSKYSEDSLKAVTESLQPGEYAFRKLGGAAFCFGVD
jgi:hypothetical protein